MEPMEIDASDEAPSKSEVKERAPNEQFPKISPKHSHTFSEKVRELLSQHVHAEKKTDDVLSHAISSFLKYPEGSLFASNHERERVLAIKETIPLKEPNIHWPKIGHFLWRFDATSLLLLFLSRLSGVPTSDMQSKDGDILLFFVSFLNFISLCAERFVNCLYHICSVQVPPRPPPQTHQLISHLPPLSSPLPGTFVDNR